MSDTPQSERRHDATPQRREQARREGQVAVGRDVVTVASLVAGGGALALAAGRLQDGLVRMMSRAAGGLVDGELSDLSGLGVDVSLLVLGVGAMAALGAAVATAAQTRGGLWPNLAAPDPSRLFQVSKLKRLFDGEALVDLGIAAAKVVAIAAAAYLALRDDFLTLATLLDVPVTRGPRVIFGPLLEAGVNVMAAMAVIAGLDLAVTRIRHSRKLKMTDQEVKREQKQEEGDPQLRNRRRQRHRELAQGRVSVEVPRADVLVVNPTHVAVALRYRTKTDGAPRVTAKGKGEAAERMRDLAHRNGVPIYRDVPLARLLHRRVKVGREVPAETYQAVAAVLAFVYRVTGRRPGEGQP